MTRRIVTIPVEDVLPSVVAVLEGQGIPRWKEPNGRTLELALEAIDLYKEKARPVGLAGEIPMAEFRGVFEGEGRNAPDSPVGPIYRASSHLALFAVTIGQEVCSEIRELFRKNDFAPGAMLDSVASEGAELTAQVLEKSYRKDLHGAGNLRPGEGTLRFSPGYCGWHISSQKTLFGILRPDDIGITLNESCLMQPLKSISGVIISGRKDIFAFDDTFSFCRDCTDHACRDRLQSVMNQ
jgi:hypothetical protein